MAKELDYLPPARQLILGAKVNRLCQLKPQEIGDTDLFINDAREIVTSLDPRVINSSNFENNLSINFPNFFNRMVGATDNGNVNLGRTRDSIKIGNGIEGYRIGAYVASAYDQEKNRQLEFEHFWDKGREGVISYEIPPATYIVYDKKTLDIREVYHLMFQHHSLSKLHWWTNQKIPLWKDQKYKSPRIANIRFMIG